MMICDDDDDDDDDDDVADYDYDEVEEKKFNNIPITFPDS